MARHDFICPDYLCVKAHKLLLSSARPWLVDDLQKWLNRLKGPNHRCAYFFTDNSGCDVVMGIMPFARFLLKRGTKVGMVLAVLPYFKFTGSQRLFPL